MTEVELVDLAARGDRDAFDLLMSDALDRLYAMARLIVRDADLAEDAVQEALIHCWRELPRLRDAKRFDAWLHRLLVNAATDQYRRRRRYTAAIALIPDAGVERDFAVEFAMADELRAASTALVSSTGRSSSCTTTSGCRRRRWPTSSACPGAR